MLEQYNFKEIEKKKLRKNGRHHKPLRPLMMPPTNFMCSQCFLTQAANYTWGMFVIMPLGMLSVVLRN